MNYEPDKKIAEELLSYFNLKRYSELINKITIIQLKFPQSVFLLNILGSTYFELGNNEKAIKSFEKIIKINPSFADAYYNLGIIYKVTGNTDKSFDCYIKCINLNPKKFEAYNNLGNIYRDRNNLEKAIEYYFDSLKINPKYSVALQNFGVCLQNYKFNKRSELIDNHIVTLLESNKILRPVDVVHNLIDYLYLDPNFKLIIDDKKDLKNNRNLDQIIKKILDFKILITLLKITPITNIKIEFFLRNLRYKILINLFEIKNKKDALILMKTMATQCFINEYIYPVKIEEKELLKSIENKLLTYLETNKKNDIELIIACLAAYKTLGLYKWSDRIINLEEISELVTQQITEPNKERILKKQLISKNINNSISLNVMKQYEKNPYPRWSKIALNRQQKNIIEFFQNLNLKFEKAKLKELKNINVLVAGCGTGQHALTTARKYENSFITALDLSLSSLSYAKRKADELQINNIEFIQMDILDIQKLNKTFDIIESVGVLHHMENPLLGWENLYKVLNQDGLMMIGLYSEIARKHIKKIRDKIKVNYLNLTDEDIKNLRDEIIKSKNKDKKILTYSSDFYSLSTIRDLLLHVKEHTFNINQIKNILKKLNLQFCGFEDRELINLFNKYYNGKEDIYNLEIWNDFELKNPRIFANMYQFWCQKT